MQLQKKYNLRKMALADNIVPMLDEQDCSAIGLHCWNGYQTDVNSRTDWEARNAAAMKLALQVVEQKTFPWPNASSIKFPLVTIAALQWQSRAYPLLVSSTDIVRMRVVGPDKTGEKAARAKRVGKYMSYQILEEDEDWEEEMDKVLIHTPIVGCSFKKTFHDAIEGHHESEFIPASALVVNYYAKSLEQAQRITHVLQLSKNEIYEREMRGYYVHTDTTLAAKPLTSTMEMARDKAQGLVQPANDEDAPLEILEQHTYLDLDGDGYQEPYIVTLRKDSKVVLRIEARFLYTNVEFNDKKEVVRIKAEQFFTKYPFIPSPDGGFYDLGFGALLGPVNESINTIINQLVDAGTMANTAGGFLSRGIKLRGGNTTFAPLEWKHVDTTGDDLRKGIMPLPVREPSNVLFTLLNLLINYGERIGMSVDVLTGENPGQNTPAETTRTMAEQGMKIFNGVFKRTYRSLRDEFRKIFRLNRLYLPNEVRFGDDSIVLAKDFFGHDHDIVPAADPNVVSDSQRAMQATMIKQAAMTTPGYDRYKVERNWLEAMKVPNIDELLPDPKGPNAQPPIPNPKLEEVKVKGMVAQAKMQDTQAKAKLKAAELMQKAEKSRAEIEKLQAETLKLMKEAQTADTGHAIELLKLRIQAEQHQRDTSLESAKLMLEMFNAETNRQEVMNGEDDSSKPGGNSVS